MRVERRGVSRSGKQSAAELPSALSAGTARLVRFAQSGILEAVGAALPLARRGGHGVVELFTLAVMFLSCRERSIRGFYSAYADVWPRVAAIVDRRSMPSGAAVSRALGRLTLEQVRDFVSVLLASHPERVELLSNPTVQYRDATGAFWHVFDFDPTTRPFRQRDLDQGPDLPEPERRAKGVPGHMGRKRGEIRQQDHLLLHAGAGLWCSYEINAGGGSAAPFFTRATAAARRWMTEIGHPIDHVLVRADGEFGHAAAVRACVDQGVRHLVRIARYHLLDRPEVAEQLANAAWWPVSGTSSMFAADLGVVTLHDSDGEVEPVETRVVVTRRRTQSEVARHGVLRDGWQLELFATSLPADAWPAPDVIKLYAGRASIENSFAQEDREYDLERTFSFNPAGQAFFVAIGLFLWNDAVCRAAAATKLPKTVAPQDSRPTETAVRWEPPLLPTTPVEPAVPPTHVAVEPEVTDAELRSIASEAVLARGVPKGWTLDPDAGVLRCPTGKPLHPFTAESARTQPNGQQVGQNRIGFRSAVGVCDGCPMRASCTTTRPNSYRQLSFRLPKDKAVRARALLDVHRQGPRPVAPRRAPVLPRAGTATPLFRPLPPTQPGPFTPSVPTFSAGNARRMMREALAAVAIELVLRRARRRRESTHPLLLTPAARRATRLSWTDRRVRASARAHLLVTVVARAIHARLLAL